MTLEGHVISRNGDMTGGTTKKDSISRFAEAKLGEAKRTRDKLEKELASLEEKIETHGVMPQQPASKQRTVRRRSSIGVPSGSENEGEIEMALVAAENRLNFAQMDLKGMKDKFNRLDKEKHVLEAKLKEMAPELAALKTSVEERAELMKEVCGYVYPCL